MSRNCWWGRDAVTITALSLLGWIFPGTGVAGDVEIAVVSGAPDVVVSIGSWYELPLTGGTFRPAEPIRHLEVALYDATAALDAGPGLFKQRIARSSASWPDGPENAAGNFGYAVAPNVLGDLNTSPYGRPNYRSLRLFDGTLSPDSVYQVTVTGTDADHVWIHPLRDEGFTMSAAVLGSSEPTLIAPVYGPAAVTRTVVVGEGARYLYTGLQPTSSTGLKDNYPVQSYGQRAGSHGNGDFGWFPGYSLGFLNEGSDPVYVALFINTGFTGPSGCPSNTLSNDTFWKSDEFHLAGGDSVIAWLDLDAVTAWSLSDNLYPHTAGGQAAVNGSQGLAVNVFDRLQVSAIGWEVRAAQEGAATTTLLVRPRIRSPYTPTAEQIGVMESGIPDPLGPRLLPAYPNPFRSGCQLLFEVPRAEPASTRITVYDVAGRRIARLLDAPRVGGPGVVTWDGFGDDGAPTPSGTYFIRLDIPGHDAVTQRVVRTR
jgi:hypothetical protein